MKILAIDPGTTKSGVVVWGNLLGGKLPMKYTILHTDILINEDVIAFLDMIYDKGGNPDIMAIEWIQSYGMAVGKSTFETCLWVGRFVEAAVKEGVPVRLIPRGAIKMHHCGSMRAKDGNVSQALRDKYGEKGTKKDPGFFFGVASHAWQACAVAAYVAEGAEDEKELRF